MHWPWLVWREGSSAKRIEPRLASGRNKPEAGRADQTVEVVRNHEGGPYRRAWQPADRTVAQAAGERPHGRYVDGGAHTENESHERRTDMCWSSAKRGALKVRRSPRGTLSRSIEQHGSVARDEALKARRRR